VGQARVAMMMLLTLRGTPTLYYGDELGMEDVPIPPEKVVDPWGILSPGIGLGRDPERTPMQWNDAANAGFTGEVVEPWLPVADDYETRNVKVQMMQPDSMLQLTRRLLALRKGERALYAGIYQSLPSGEGVFAYSRSDGDDVFVVVLNFTGEEQVWEMPAFLQPVLSTYMDGGERRDAHRNAGIVQLRPNEGVILKDTHVKTWA
jgi:alpha-glucosidase